MITSWHHGMKSEVTVEQFKNEMDRKTFQAALTHGKQSAGKIARAVKAKLAAKVLDWDYAVSDIHLSSLAKKYGVQTVLIPVVVVQARALLNA